MKKQKPENFLEKIPACSGKLGFSTDKDGIVTLEIENKGFFNRVAQIFFKKPKVSYVHLDKFGSFVWPLIDGSSDIEAIAKKVDEYFGEEAHPLYERLIKYFQILESYNFVYWVK